jgi:HEAT repeat protein
VLAILQLTSRRVVALDFGEPVGPRPGTEELLEWIVADYDNRRDHQWRIRPSAGVAVLSRWLQANPVDPNRLVSLLRALGWYGQAAATLLAAERLAHEDERVREAAVRAMGQMGVFAVADLVEPLLRDLAPRVRRAAVSALGKIGGADRLPPLTAAAADPALQSAVGEARALIAAGEQDDPGHFVKAMIETAEWEDLTVVAVLCWEDLLSILKDVERSPEIRARAARLLGLARVAGARRALADFLVMVDEATIVRIEAALALGRLQSTSAIPTLIRWLDSDDQKLQRAAVIALGEIGHPAALEPLARHWGDRDGALRDDIRQAVWWVGHRLGAETLIEALARHEENPIQRTFTIDDQLQFVVDRPQLVRGRLTSPRREARRDAALLISFLGTREDARALADLATRDDDDLNRYIAALGSTSLFDKWPS